MKDTIERIFKESIAVKEKALAKNVEKISEAASTILTAINNGGTVFFFGNGGSAADSQHIAAEFIGRFQKERRALPAIALTTDTSILTALGNDYSLDIIFARQLEGLAKKGDVAVGISTSGNSGNVVEGIKKAKELGLKTISLTGHEGGALASMTDVSIIVPSQSTARIQESHLCVAHCICELVEENI
ncbi:MAG: D-sedoheptulose 7-phosphate isomerase [Candidatus Omnitrophica bacterium]|nr:D-sedoheptulose 7-phosphate isomerase [Candidatus Omnitrophota bacterium]